MTTLPMYVVRYGDVVPIFISCKFSEGRGRCVKGVSAHDENNLLDMVLSTLDKVGYDTRLNGQPQWEIQGAAEGTFNAIQFSYAMMAAYLKESGQVNTISSRDLYCASISPSGIMPTDYDKDFVMRAFRDGIGRAFVSASVKERFLEDPDIQSIVGKGFSIVYISAFKDIDKSRISVFHPGSGAFLNGTFHFPFKNEEQARNRFLEEILYHVKMGYCGEYPSDEDALLEIVESQLTNDGLIWGSPDGSWMKLSLHEVPVSKIEHCGGAFINGRDAYYRRKTVEHLQHSAFFRNAKRYD